MFVAVEGLRFPVPLREITWEEQELIERLDSCRKSGRQFIGEAKISDRQTVIILSYLISALLRQGGQHNSNDGLQQPRRDDDSLKTVVYLCRGETHKLQLAKIAEEVYQYVLRELAKEHLSTFSLENQPAASSNIVLKFYEGGPDDQRSHEETMEYCKANDFVFKRIYFMKAQRFLQFKLRRKEDAIWKKGYEFGCETDFNVEQLNYLPKRADFLLIETNDLQGILYELFTVELYEIHLQRAYIQFKKLNRFYNFRLEERKIKKENGKYGSKRDMDRDDEVVEGNNHQNNHQNGTNNRQEIDGTEEIRQESEEKKPWNVADYDKRFNDLYKQTISMVHVKVGYVPNTSVSPQFQECYYLTNLQTVGYILSFLIVEWKNSQFQEGFETLSNYLNSVYTKTMVISKSIRKLRRTFLSFVHKHPPVIARQELSYAYIDQVLYFFEKAVIWNETFCRPANQTEQPSHPDINTGNRFYVFRQKTNKDSNLKLVSFDQRILIELLAQSAKNFSILQNLIISFDYYQGIFRPSNIKDLIFEYRCPKVAGRFKQFSLSGLIVSSTPNQEDLHLSSDKQENTSVDLLEDKKVDKDHYSQIIRAYGVLVHDICELMPDGVVVYFPTRTLLKDCRAQWQSKENIYQKINELKPIFQQQEWQKENIVKVMAFKKKCQIGRGAVYFISAESQFAKYQTFYGYLSKCILFLGVPYNPYPLETKVKLEFLKLKEHFHFEEAMKNVCRCLSNCINSSEQSKVVVFADIEYNRSDLQKKWFPFICEGNLNTLEVLDNISRINQKNTISKSKQREQQKKRKREQVSRKCADRQDFVRRASYSHMQ